MFSQSLPQLKHNKCGSLKPLVRRTSLPDKQVQWKLIFLKVVFRDNQVQWKFNSAIFLKVGFPGNLIQWKPSSSILPIFQKGISFVLLGTDWNTVPYALPKSFSWASQSDYWFKHQELQLVNVKLNCQWYASNNRPIWPWVVFWCEYKYFEQSTPLITPWFQHLSVWWSGAGWSRLTIESPW